MALPPKNPASRTSAAITAAMFILCAYTGILAALSLIRSKLYSPVASIVSFPPEPSYYIGISIYITVAATLLTSALIRVALRISK